MDKETIKKELVDKSNDILARYSEPEDVEDISIMNMSSKIVFLGSLRVYDETNVPKIKRDLTNDLNKYGDLSIRDQKVTPCCAPSYFHISYNISVEN